MSRTSWLCFVAVFLVFVSSTQADRDHNCVSWGRVYRHGTLFPRPGGLRCLRYICWYGRVILREEGCEVDGQCHRVGSTFQYNCARYRCDKLDLGTHLMYKPETQSTQCRDYRGRCYRPGQHFAFFIGNVYFPRCTCTATVEKVHYTCESRNIPDRFRSGRVPYRVRSGSGVTSKENVTESEDVSSAIAAQKEEK